MAKKADLMKALITANHLLNLTTFEQLRELNSEAALFNRFMNELAEDEDYKEIAAAMGIEENEE